jgi:hypothetical protein
MIVVQRNEVSRTRLLSFLAIFVSAVALAGIVSLFPGQSETLQVILIAIGAAAVLAIVLAILQVWAHPRRSQVILFQRGEEFIIATNALHEGFKLRFLRDILGEGVCAFSDEDRARWKNIEPTGFYATMNVRGVRKVILLRLCTMIFDDVFVSDAHQRWEHHDCSNTAEPSFSRRAMPEGFNDSSNPAGTGQLSGQER